jgi:hypothetical protein
MGKHGINPMAGHMVCVVNKVTSGQVFYEVIGLSLVKYHSTNTPYSFYFIQHPIIGITACTTTLHRNLINTVLFPHIFYLNQHIYWGRSWITKDSCFDSSRR